MKHYFSLHETNFLLFKCAIPTILQGNQYKIISFIFFYSLHEQFYSLCSAYSVMIQSVIMLRSNRLIRLPVSPRRRRRRMSALSETAGQSHVSLQVLQQKTSNYLHRSIVACSSDSRIFEMFPMASCTPCICTYNTLELLSV